MRPALVIAIVGALFAPELSFAQEPDYRAARYAGGGLPGIAPQAIGPGEAIVELSIDATGRVEKITPIRSTPPYTQMLIDSVRSWSFEPATDDPIGPDGKHEGRRAVRSKVLVAALYRAPTLLTPTQGERPVTVAAASTEVAYPASTSEPPFPVRSVFAGVVMVEARVAASGLSTPRMVSPPSPMDGAALEAARQWRFFPARVKDNADTYAYVIFGFPQPITGR
jgi:outer membrane biosynthesis protein TonB